MPNSNTGFSIAVIASGIDEEYQQSILSGIHRYAAQHQVSVSHFIAFGGILANRKYDQGEYNIFSLPNFSKFDGVILLSNTFSCTQTEELYQRIREAGIPAVSIDREIEGFYSIGIENAPAMESIVRHLIEKHGVRTLNFISGPDTNTENTVRFEAFSKVLAEYNIPLEEERIYHGTFRAKDGRRAIHTFINSGKELPQAIVCANDAMAISAVLTLQEYGIRCPEDIIVSGFDNTYNARHLSPSLTTVERPLMQSGSLACEILCRHAAGEELPLKHNLNAVPIYSESCGCPNAEAEDITVFKRLNYQTKEIINRDVSRIDQMVCALVECDSFEEYINTLKPFIQKTKCDEFYLCLNDNWHARQIQRETGYNGEMPEETYIINGYSKRMMMPICYYDGEFHVEEGFNSAEMLPRFRIDSDAPRNLFFVPLHFRERCLGYFAFVNAVLPITARVFHSWSISISNSLENLRKLLCLDEMVQELDKLYTIDSLTGVYNRNGFKQKSTDFFAQCIEQKKTVMIMFADMDGLKAINDTFGHKEGDHAIRSVASILQTCCRGNEIVSRFGGDEFLIFGADYTPEMEEALRDRIQQNLDICNRNSGRPYALSISLGACITVPPSDSSVFQLVTIADNKMYEEKKKKNPSKYLKQIMNENPT